MQSPQEFIEQSPVDSGSSVPEMTPTIVPDNLKYKNKAKQPSYYKHHDIVANDGLTTQAVSLNSSHETVFDVGTSVCNLSRSYVDFHMTIPALASYYNYAYVNMVPWESIELRSKNGTVIAPVKNLQHYWKTVCSASLDAKKLMSRHSVPAATAVNYNTMCHFMNPAKNATGAQLCALNTLTAATQIATSATRAPVYSLQDLAVTAAVNNALVLNCRVFLSDIAHTFFAQDQDIYSKQSLELAITWAPGVNVGWTAKTATGGDRDGTNDDDVVALASTHTITNCYLKLALQQEPDSIAFTKQLVNSGQFKVLFPYATTYSQAMGTGTSYNFQQRINSGAGRTLLRCISAAVMTSRAGGYNGDARDLLGVHKVSQHQSFMDTNPLQSKALLHTTGEQYKYVQDLLDGSAIAQSPFDYEIYNVHVDDFSGCRRLIDHAYENRMESGWALNKELLYNIELTKSAASLSLFLAVITQRMLTITPQGINVSA